MQSLSQHVCNPSFVWLVISKYVFGASSEPVHHVSCQNKCLLQTVYDKIDANVFQISCVMSLLLRECLAWVL